MSSKTIESMSNATSWTRQVALEKVLRKAGGLNGGQGFHPAPGIFQRQAEAVARLRELVQNGEYTEAQIGVFAQEIGDGGVRNFMVDTYAGFALNNSPTFNPQVFAALVRDVRSDGPRGSQASQQSAGSTTDPGSLDHLYELILEDRPCWLYFDLEYSRTHNPSLDPAVAMDAFRNTLASFFADALGTKLDLSGLIELDSTTPLKFSKHVLVQRFWRQDGSSPECMAFANNAQAGLLVSELIAYSRTRRDTEGSMSASLFVVAPASARDKTGAPQETTLIDESVYSRNRCFRLLFHRKFGKQSALQFSRSSIIQAFGRSEVPPLQLLRTMASYVPEGTPLFHHAMIPRDFGHALLKGVRLNDGGSERSADRGADNQLTKVDPVLHNDMLQFLVDKWNSIRDANDPTTGGRSAGVRPTIVQSVVKMSDQFLCVTLGNNRFCFCKGESHVSNSVYMVVDLLKGQFHQKCHDSDCKHFRSVPFAIPAWLVTSGKETGLGEELPAPTIPRWIDALPPYMKDSQSDSQEDSQLVAQVLKDEFANRSETINVERGDKAGCTESSKHLNSQHVAKAVQGEFTDGFEALVVEDESKHGCNVGSPQESSQCIPERVEGNLSQRLQASIIWPSSSSSSSSESTSSGSSSSSSLSRQAVGEVKTADPTSTLPLDDVTPWRPLAGRKRKLHEGNLIPLSANP